MEYTPRVVAAIALTPRARAIAEFASNFALLLGADLTLVYAGVPAADERQQLDEIVAALEHEGSAPMFLIRKGRPDKVIRQIAVETHADVVVLGALEHDSAVRDILGSVARKTARRVPCSVLLLPDPSNASLETIVVSTRLDESSASMVKFTIDLASRAGTRKLHVVHEHQAEAGVARLVTPAEEVSQYQQQQADVDRHLLADFLAAFDTKGIDVRRKSLEGFEGSEAVRYAKHREAGLLVIGAPQRRLSLWDRFFHHPIENVLQNLPCAVLLYRHIPSKQHSRQ